jgi:hypothetical protein
VPLNTRVLQRDPAALEAQATRAIRVAAALRWQIAQEAVDRAIAVEALQVVPRPGYNGSFPRIQGMGYGRNNRGSY